MLPIIKATLEYPKARTLYVAPAKALCDDQLTAWRRLLCGDDQFRGLDVPAFTGRIRGSELSVIRYDADVKGLVWDQRSAACAAASTRIEHNCRPPDDRLSSLAR
jgi:hypothetical protein